MSIFDLDELYTDNYYDYVNFRKANLSRNVTDNKTSFHEISWISVTRLLFTILLRIGFFFVQIGSVPVTNINLILLQNIVDFSWTTLVYVIGGFVISYNGDISGIIGEGRWIGDERIIDKDEALVGWQATVVASAIFTSCLVGRIHTIGHLLVGLIMAGIVQPFAIHWTWTTKGWMSRNNLDGRDVAFRDYGGSTIVHTVGSLTGYIGCVILGRRILRLRDIDDGSVSADSAGTTLAGYSLILLGLQSLCFPSTTRNHPRTTDKEISLIIVNNLLGATSCSLVVVALHFILSREPFNHWTVMRCVQATIAGTTIVSAGVNFYNPLMCLGLGFSGGIIHYLVSRRVFQSALEDYCNIVATHLVCSIVGSFAVPFALNTTDNIVNDPLTMLLNVAWQIICLVALVALVTVPITLAFGLLECLGLLRNRSEIVNHFRAIVAAGRGPSRSYMQRLFLPDGETLYLQPCTAHLRHRGKESTTRFTNNQLSTIKIEKPQEETARDMRKSVNSEIFLCRSSPSVVGASTRVKKFRQVHTLRSSSDTAIFKIDEHGESMGDDGKFNETVKEVSRNVEKEIGDNDEMSIVHCSGDSSKKSSTINDYLLNDKTAIRDSVAREKNFKRQREPYRLHRTKKFMNLRLEAINENNESLKFLVRPTKQCFSSTESDSENEGLITMGKKYPGKMKNFVSVGSV